MLIAPQPDKKFLLIFWNAEYDYQFFNFPPLVPIQRHVSLVHAPPSYVIEVHFNIIHFLCLGFPSGVYPSGFHNKPCMHLFSPQYVSHFPPISFSLTCSPDLHLARCTYITKILIMQFYPISKPPQ